MDIVLLKNSKMQITTCRNVSRCKLMNELRAAFSSSVPDVRPQLRGTSLSVVFTKEMEFSKFRKTYVLHIVPSMLENDCEISLSL